MAEKVVTTIKDDKYIGNKISMIKQKLLRRSPEFLAVMKKLSNKIEETGLAARHAKRFANIEIYRLDRAAQEVSD